KKRKQEQLLVHLQMLLHDAGEDPQPTCEVLDYFMRRLSSQQASARKLAAKGLNLVLTQPNRSPGSDDDDLLEKETSEHSWLLKYMPLLPHFDVAKSQACFVLRQACHVENDPLAISAYVHFLSAYSPVDDQQNVGDLALDMAQMIVERPTIVNCILPSNGNSSSRKNSFLIAISKIFTTYLKQVQRPSKEAYAWSESQGHILVQWANGQAAIMHILVVHTMVILLTYGPPEGDQSHFEEMMEAWFPSDSEPPQAFLVDTSEQALLLPDWLKLRMIHSYVDILVDAALKDLDAGQLVLFVQSFGIPVFNMSKLLKALDIAVEFDSSSVDQAVVDKSYMAQLVQVQHQRGAVGGLNFSALLGEADCVEMDTKMEPTPAQTPVIQRAPPKPPSVLPIPLALTQLFVESSPLTVGQELFKGLQKDLTVSVAKKHFDQGALYVFLCACEQLLEGKNNKVFVDGLLQKRLYSCVLFRIATAALANTDMSINPLTSKCVWICRQIITLAGSCVSPLLSILRQFLKQHGQMEVPVRKGKCWKNLSQVKLSSDIVIKVILKVEQEQPSYIEEAVCDLIKEGIKQGQSKELVIALTEVLIKKVMDSSILSLSATHQISLYIDWLHHLEPELIGSCPELQQQLLFMKHHESESGKLPSDLPVLFQPCLWALLIHQASWETMNGCIKSLLDKNTMQTCYNPTAVLTFLWACIHIPKIWQGRDKKIPKHYQEEDILALTKDQLTTVVNYILEESVNMCKTTVTQGGVEENSAHKKTEVNPVVALRVPLLLRCCSSSCKIKFVVDHLLDVINNKSDSLYKDSGHQLLVQLYLQVPSLVFKVSELSSVLKDSQNTTSGPSKMDVFSHTLLTSLSFMGSNDLSKDRFSDLELVCRKMASSHPLLVLRQLPLISVLLCGRVNLEFSTFISQRHMNLLTCMLGLLELLVPHLFRSEYASALADTLDTYMEIFEIHGTQRDLVSLMNRYLQLLQQYLSASPSSARAFLHRRQSTLMYLSAQYPDLLSLKSLMTGISVTSTDLSSSIHEMDRESDRGEIKGQTTTTSSRFLRTSSAWTQAQLAPLAARLSQTNHPEDIAAALHELKAVADKRPAILEHFVDDLKQLMQSPFDSCHSTAFHLVLYHLKTKPGCCKQYLSAFLQCLESKHPNVVLTAVECLPEFVVLAQEYATVVLQKAFLIGITSNLNTAPQISKSIKLLHLQTGS
ncbi:integrator complex subunit 1-like, partial [Limulus polyphemus]|uniref:Integrator complex subunit 1-like n=1 Tax=Limulus polyphemus TaxID=6850 RepID=A0ABM1BTR7_LIMPO